MIKIQGTNNDLITKENLHEQSLVTLTLESNNPTLLFKNPEAAEKAREIFSDSAINTRIVEISKKFENLTKEYSSEAIEEVFRDLIEADQQLYLDIITAAFYIAIKHSDMEYVKFMYKMCDIVNEEFFNIASSNTSTEESSEPVEKKEVIIDDDDEGIK